MKIPLNKKRDLNEILSEYYIKNYGNIKYNYDSDYNEYCYMYGDYLPDFFRGSRITKVSEITGIKRTVELDDKYISIFDIENILQPNYKEYLNYVVTQYEFALPIHKEVLKDISLFVKNYKYLYIIVEYKSGIEVYSKRVQMCLDILVEYKVYFMFYCETVIKRHKKNEDDMCVTEYLFCVNKNIAQEKFELEKKLKKIFKKSKISVIILKDGIEFFNRSKFYSKINLRNSKIFLLVHIEMGFHFFDYKEDLLDFFKLGIHLKANINYFMHSGFLTSGVLDYYFEGNYDLYEKKKKQDLNLVKFKDLKLLPYSINLDYLYVPLYEFNDKKQIKLN
ncbi:MAG: hypothetical protein ACK4IX_14320 [Candidatus Sericytochromatia bacterium]